MKYEKLNKEIKLPFGLCDVAEIRKTYRILYFKEEKKIILKSCARLAKFDNETKYKRKAEILTASQAVRRYPGVFTNSLRRQFDGDIRTIMLRVPADMHVFCCRQGNITNYLRSLIKKEMKKTL